MVDLLSLAEDFMRHATRAGADAADVLAVHSTDLNCSIRKSTPETLERSESTGLGLRVFIGNAYASVSTSNLASHNLKSLAETAISIARAAPPDAFSSLAPEHRLARTLPNCDVYDANEPTLEQLQAQCLEAESTGTSHTGITNSEGADAGYSAHRTALITSHGFAGETQSSYRSLSLSLIAGIGGDMQRDYAYSTARHGSDLKSAIAIGNEAAERTLRRLHPRKIESIQCPLVFDPRVARSLLSSFVSAINGSAITRGTSFLKGAMGQTVFGPSITITDDPLRLRGLASKSFDGEGVATSPLTLIEGGVLQSWLLDTRSARQLGLETTGHASRGLGSAPSPSSTNVMLHAGNVTPQALMADIREGIYITEAFGMGVNLITGDYSQGASGFMIRNGERTEAVSEITIAGHLRDMFAHIIAADDLQFESSINAPTLRIDGMTVAGA